jgi:hypothetical protein
MALHPSFPKPPYEPLLPEHRWFPADEALRETAFEPRGYLAPKRSLFTKIVGEARADGLELDFAGFLDTVPGVVGWPACASGARKPPRRA